MKKTDCTHNDDGEFTPLLTTKDWNEEWIELQHKRKTSDNSEFWDERSKTYRKNHAHSNYVEDFLKYAEIKPGEKVFDMGCGNGALAIPLAREGHPVIAADFSKGMLEALREDASCYGNLPIDIKRVGWSDDWQSVGIEDGCVDVAIASRSISTENLKESLEKLSSVAKRRCCVTLPTGSSPRTDEEIIKAIGLQNEFGKDYVYAIMILIEAGYLPEVKYISSERKDSFDDLEDAFSSLKKMIDSTSYKTLSPEKMDKALKNLKVWLGDNLIDNPKAGKVDSDGFTEKSLILKNPRTIRWAFIAWDVTTKQ